MFSDTTMETQQSAAYVEPRAFFDPQLVEPSIDMTYVVVGNAAAPDVTNIFFVLPFESIPQGVIAVKNPDWKHRIGCRKY